MILERKSIPLWSSSTLMGASVFALSTSFVFFAYRGRHQYRTELYIPFTLHTANVCFQESFLAELWHEQAVQ